MKNIQGIGNILGVGRMPDLQGIDLERYRRMNESSIDVVFCTRSTVYIADFDLNIKSTFAIDSSAATSLAVDNAFIYVTYTTYLPTTKHELRKYDKQGNLITSFTDVASISGVSVDGENVWTCKRNSETLTKHDKETLSPLSSYTTDVDDPRGIAVDNTHLYHSRTFSTYHGAEKRLKSNYSLTAKYYNFPSVYSPTGIAVDDSYCYLSSPDSTPSKIIVLNKSNMTVATTITTGISLPQGLSVSSDFLFVANAGDNKLLKISKTTWGIVNSINVSEIRDVGVQQQIFNFWEL